MRRSGGESLSGIGGGGGESGGIAAAARIMAKAGRGSGVSRRRQRVIGALALLAYQRIVSARTSAGGSRGSLGLGGVSRKSPCGLSGGGGVSSSSCMRKLAWRHRAARLSASYRSALGGAQ